MWGVWLRLGRTEPNRGDGIRTPPWRLPVDLGSDCTSPRKHIPRGSYVLQSCMRFSQPPRAVQRRNARRRVTSWIYQPTSGKHKRAPWISSFNTFQSRGQCGAKIHSISRLQARRKLGQRILGSRTLALEIVWKMTSGPCSPTSITSQLVDSTWW